MWVENPAKTSIERVKNRQSSARLFVGRMMCLEGELKKEWFGHRNGARILDMLQRLIDEIDTQAIPRFWRFSLHNELAVADKFSTVPVGISSQGSRETCSPAEWLPS